MPRSSAARRQPGVETRFDTGRRTDFRWISRTRTPEFLRNPREPPHRRTLSRFIAAEGVTATAGLVADEIVRLLAGTTVRDRSTGVRREARPADIAILFRSRDSHRDFETALEARGVSTYVYKGLGFFDADEIQDAVALLRYLADPLSDLRAAALLRSRIVRLSDRAVAQIASDPAVTIMGGAELPESGG